MKIFDFIMVVFIALVILSAFLFGTQFLNLPGIYRLAIAVPVFGTIMGWIIFHKN